MIPKREQKVARKGNRKWPEKGTESGRKREERPYGKGYFDL